MATVISQEEKKILVTIRENIRQLMKMHGLTVSNFCKYIENKKELSIDRSTFSKFMNREGSKPNLAFLVSCSRAFEIPLDHLISQDFNPNENFQKIREKYQEISMSNPDANIFNFEYLSKDVFITNPGSPLLQKYIQPYFCYYYSTVAAENNTDKIQDALISGELIIEACDTKCKATLKINTKILDENGNPKFKIYEGDVVLCPSIQSVHCILTLPEGEFCFIIFRYSHLNIKMQECRLAEVLSTSSTPDKRYPVVHRMLLSREQILEKDWAAITPHLCMNSSEIMINKEGLLELGNISSAYSHIAQEILQRPSEQMYCIPENTVKEISQNYLKSEELPVLLAELRSHSFSKRYNKVSTTADEEIRKILLKRGYFQKNA